MTTLAVEIHDAGLLTVREGAETEPAASSPGYALLDGGELVLGRAARERARLQPRRVHHRFWEELDSAALPRPFPRHLTRADLVHAHLSQLWQATGADAASALLAVPGSFSGRRLGLLLGVARAAGLPVEGMVDLALAATAGTGAEGGKVLHLDLHLHRAVVTEITCTGGDWVRRRVETTTDVGLVALEDAWARHFAHLFVRATRFDPLHAADCEQALYRALPGWLAALRRKESAVAVLAAGTEERSIELTRDDAEAAAAELYPYLLERVHALKRAGEPATLLLAPEAAALPGLAERLAALRDTRLVELPAAAAAAGALTAAEAIRTPGEALPFVTRLPAVAGGPAAAAGETAAPGRPPTHILLDGLARPITERPLLIGTEVPEGGHGLNLTGATAGVSRRHCRLLRRGGRVVVEDLSTWGSFLNEERVAGSATLAAGDRLRLGNPGVELELIAVEEAEDTEDEGAA